MTEKALPSQGTHGYETSSKQYIKIKVDNNGVVNTV